MAWKTLVAVKLTRVLSQYWTVLLAGMLILGIASTAIAAWHVSNPPTVEVIEETNQEVIRTDVETTARVTSNSTMFDRGEVLRNRQVYFERPTPTVEVTVGAIGPADSGFEVQHDLALVYRVVIDESSVWEQEDPLTAATASPNDGKSTLSVTLSIPDIRGRVREIQSEAGAGVIEVSLVHEVNYRTNRYDGTMVATAPLALPSGTYAIGGGLTDEARLAESVTKREIDEAAGHVLAVRGREVFVPQVSVIGGAFGVLLLVLAVVVAVASPRDVDPATLDRKLIRLRHANWISEGKIDYNHAVSRAEMASLADLVDIAIDSNRRIVFDTERAVYAVVVDDILYHYVEGEDGWDPHEPDQGEFQWATESHAEPASRSGGEGPAEDHQDSSGMDTVLDEPDPPSD